MGMLEQWRWRAYQSLHRSPLLVKSEVSWELDTGIEGVRGKWSGEMRSFLEGWINEVIFPLPFRDIENNATWFVSHLFRVANNTNVPRLFSQAEPSTCQQIDIDEVPTSNSSVNTYSKSINTYSTSINSQSTPIQLQ